MNDITIRDYEYRDAPAWIFSDDHGHSINPFLHGPFAPICRELITTDLEVEGEIPRDLNGVYLRNGPNPRYQSKGTHHWFDGDGMLHALEIRDGKLCYRNRWIRTEHFDMESRAQHCLWPGYAMKRPDPQAPPGAGTDFSLKDVSNTDVKWYNGAVITSLYQAGTPYRVDPRGLQMLGVESFGGKLPRQMSAHMKVDDSSGEIMFFDYSMNEPYLCYGVGSAAGQLTNYVEIPVPSPRLPHDMAITEHYSILHDLPLFWDPGLLRRGQHALRWHPHLPARFAVIPRHGDASQIRWFEAQPCYIYHVINAYEDGDDIVMDGCRIADPYPPRKRGEDMIARMVALGTWPDVKLYRWRFNLRTGQTREQPLDDLNTEFPTINAEVYHGKPYRYAYNMLIPTDKTIRFEGICKYDLATGQRDIYRFEEGVVGSESPFAPRDNAVGEDDGYLISFTVDGHSGVSRADIFDAGAIGDGPVCRIKIPQRVPVGFHACWVNADKAFSDNNA